MSTRVMKDIKQKGGQWVQKAFSHNHGALHRELGVPQGQTIPESKLEKAEHSQNPTLKKRAVLAENARHFNH